MKLTKKRLQNIIKEEIQTVLHEQAPEDTILSIIGGVASQYRREKAFKEILQSIKDVGLKPSKNDEYRIATAYVRLMSTKLREELEKLSPICDDLENQRPFDERNKRTPEEERLGCAYVKFAHLVARHVGDFARFNKLKKKTMRVDLKAVVQAFSIRSLDMAAVGMSAKRLVALGKKLKIRAPKGTSS